MTTTETLTLQGIAATATTCACCDRTIRKGYTLSDGRVYGRKCAALATGYPTTAMEHQARQVAFLARRDTDRRAAGWGYTEFLANLECGNDPDAVVYVYDTEGSRNVRAGDLAQSLTDLLYAA